MAELNFVERIGLDVLRRRIGREDSQIHKWSHAELAEIQQIERRTKIVAAFAGATSGAILGLAEIWLGEGALRPRRCCARWRAISSIAGLSLLTREVEQLVARGLSRAALEIPNPRQPIHGIDPYARVPRWKLVAYALLYRIKIGATSFVLRVLLRRILSRAALRVFIPLVAIPVYATWNALIARWVMREVRIRVAGPLVVQQLGERIAADRTKLDEVSRQLIVEAVGEVILRGEDAHPNYALLLARLFEDLSIVPESVRIDWDSRRSDLAKLHPQAQDLLLTILTVAAILNSRLRRSQRDMLAEAFSLCGRPFRPQAVLDLRREFVNGEGLSEKQLRRLAL